VEDILQRQEQVLLPSAGYDAMGPLLISWTTDNSWRGVPGSSELVLDVVDILLSTDGGLNYNPTPITLGEVNDGEYQWVPNLGGASANARIKIVWHNVVNLGTVEAESEVFSYGGRPFQMANRSVETGLAASLSAVPAIGGAEPYGVAVVDYTDPVPDAIVSYTNVQGQIYAAEELDGSGAPLLRNRSIEAFQVHPLDFIGAGHRGVAIGNFDTNPDLWSPPGSDQGSDLFLARETGARVYRSLGLSGEQFPQYQDVIDEYFGGSVLFDGSWCGQWTDTNGDGLLDLVVGRAALPQGGAASDPPDPETLDAGVLRLFLQRDSADPQAPGFDEVGLISGLTGVTATISLVAVDLDGDSDRDLVVGDLRTAARGGTSMLYRNDSGTFTALTQFSAGGAPASVSGVAVADLDGDGTLDIVVSRQGSAGELPPQAFRGLGSMNFAAPLNLPVSFSQSGVSVFDHDGNQTPDLLFLPEGSQDSPAFLANLSSPGQVSFLDRTAAVGLDDSGKVGGGAAADFDGDGRTDLFLGRRVDGNKFFYRSEKIAPIPDEPVHIAIQIEGGDGGNPEGGDGALLTLLRNGQPMASQNYALPSGGSQSDQPVLFAVPDDGATYTVQTAWGEGYVQTDAVQPGQVNQVQDGTSPSVVPASMTAFYTPGPGGTMSLTFEWDCSNQAVHGSDRSHVSSDPGCLPGDLVIAPGQSDVTAECSTNPNGTEHHKLTIANMDCIPQCVYTWWCESSTRFVTSDTSASTKTIKTKVCIQ